MGRTRGPAQVHDKGMSRMLGQLPRPVQDDLFGSCIETVPTKRGGICTE
jgi:hypothetical protein